MKRNILTLLMAIAWAGCMAQFDAQNSLVRKTIVNYQLGGDGYWHKTTGTLVDNVDAVEATYAFEKKSGTVYVQTKTGNFMVVLNKEFAKVYKQSKLAPIIDEKLLQGEVDRVTRMIEDRYETLNEARRQHQRDSIERARLDSIEKARQDSLQAALKKATEDNYRLAHNWHQLPVSRIGIECVDCGKQLYQNEIYCEGISNDTIYYSEPVKGVMDCSYMKMHAGLIGPKLARDEKFKYHCVVFADSLNNRPYLSLGYLASENKARYAVYAEEVAVKAPNGYVDEWGYDFQDGRLVFDFSYTNTSSKEVRSVDIYYNIVNAAGASKKTGKLRGEGPVATFESHQWSWTETNIVVPDGSVDMEISRLVITFKDGKTKVIAKKDLLIKDPD